MKNKNLKTKIFNSKSETSDVRSVVAKSDDGTIQITFTVPYEKITKAKEEALLDIGKDLEVPGFRKGKAPTDKVLNQVSQNTLIEKSLAKILPSCL